MEDTEGERHGAVESVKMRVLIPKSPALRDLSRQTDPKEELPESWVSGEPQQEEHGNWVWLPL